MITTGLLLIGTTLIGMLLTVIGTLFPRMEIATMKSAVDSFVEIQEQGLKGFYFVAGDFSITLIKYALAIYIIYYSILIIYEIVLKIILKGQ